MKILFKILTLIILATLSFSCSDEESNSAKLAFSRSIYILPSSGELNVELRATMAPSTDITVPIEISGSAVLDSDYTISGKEFIIKAGETKASIKLMPKNNLTADREIKLALMPVKGYDLGNKKVAIIPVETKERIMYTFSLNYSRMLSSIEVWVKLNGEISGRKFRAPRDITLPIKIDESSTAVLGEDFEIEGGKTSVTINKNEYMTHFTVKVKDGAKDYTGKIATLILEAPEEEKDLYYPGSFISYKIKLDQLKFIDMLGNWKPVAIINKDSYLMEDIPEEEYAGLLPENNGENDYLEFTTVNGVDKIIPHLTGDLKNFFSNPEGHNIVFDHIEKSLDDYSTFESYDAPYFVISDVNTCFSSKKTVLGNVYLGLDMIDDNNIIIYFHQYTPTDFLVQSYNDVLGGEFDIDFFPDFFGITYKFTRVSE